MAPPYSEHLAPTSTRVTVSGVNDASRHLAQNLRALRDVRGLSQQRIATLCGLPRATWATLESGQGNPTLNVLMTLSETLQVTIEELVAAPRPDIRHYRGDELHTKVRGGVTVRKLLPDPIPGLEFERLELPRGKTMVGVPHTPGTREYLTCESGRVELVVGGETYPVLPGEVVSFRGDQKHSYRNGADCTTVAYSAVLVSPATR